MAQLRYNCHVAAVIFGRGRRRFDKSDVREGFIPIGDSVGATLQATGAARVEAVVMTPVSKLAAWRSRREEGGDAAFRDRPPAAGARALG
jgi:hypothetical protein